MRILFVCDPLAQFKPEKDSTLAMMHAAQARGHQVWVCQADDLEARWQPNASEIFIDATEIKVHSPSLELSKPGPEHGVNKGSWFSITQSRRLSPHDLDVAIMRKDPPFDVHYLVATQMLDRLQAKGLKVINRPQALRDHGEKMAVLEFTSFAPPGMVSHRIDRLKDFASSQPQVVFKPLDAMGGAGIFVSHARDPNLPVILEMLTEQGRRAIMAQRYLPEIAHGDKRILLINGQAIPYCLARIPPEGASRGNLAAGGRGEARPLSAKDQEIASALGPILAARGLFLVGLDVIGDCLTEINVTSPTGFQEITRQTGFNVAEKFVQALEEAQLNRAE